MFADGVSIWIFLPALLVVYYLLSIAGRLKKKQAIKYLDEGAVLVDVRTSEEFNSGYVEGSINIPLQRLDLGAKEKLKNKKQVVLCFCLSGARSSSAVSQFRRLGYTAYNLGGASRAKRIVSERNGQA